MGLWFVIGWPAWNSSLGPIVHWDRSVGRTPHGLVHVPCVSNDLLHFSVQSCLSATLRTDPPAKRTNLTLPMTVLLREEDRFCDEETSG
jgi:hypothetical protein